jgi:hypothetical protein
MKILCQCVCYWPFMLLFRHVSILTLIFLNLRDELNKDGATAQQTDVAIIQFVVIYIVS